MPHGYSDNSSQTKWHLHQAMLIPPLAYPATVLSRDKPAALAVKTNRRRVPAVTGMLSPVAVPMLISPIEIIPVKLGVSATASMGTKILFGVADAKMVASIVTVLPISESAAVVEKNAVISVITPSRGTENAKFVNVPAGLVRSIWLPTMDTPGAEEPKPT